MSDTGKGRTIEERTAIELPKFWELAEGVLAYAGPRDKTINVKIAINTARMMVKAEKREFADVVESDPRVRELAAAARVGAANTAFLHDSRCSQIAGYSVDLCTCKMAKDWQRQRAALKAFDKSL